MAPTQPRREGLREDEARDLAIQIVKRHPQFGDLLLNVRASGEGWVDVLARLRAAVDKFRST